jgi:hypothetical protein
VAGSHPIKLALCTHGVEFDALLKRKEEVHRNIVFSMDVSNANKSTLGKGENTLSALSKKTCTMSLPI